MYKQVENLQSETVSRLELKFQANSQSPRSVDCKKFLVESSSDDLRYETRNSFRGGTDALHEYLCDTVAFARVRCATARVGYILSAWELLYYRIY
ncbi:hypothetical protein IQ244_20080 [Nostoc sp. LEGE 06077]|uniref:hypothetical protein n=1 Tax=Nostoc sp. LEGE 06077 TaxID=915325 RepID=UPI00187FBEA9|nr:hypothetical protein [Nostoc sp. LEGE 06077]MBE9208797.1 hypothetical protein [Nostoc sp. LEGE 06077]